MQASNLHHLRTATCGFLVLLVSSTAFGQGLQRQNRYTSRLQQSPNAPTPAMQYFGSGLPSTTTTQQSQQLLPPPQPVQIAGAKPFHNLQRGATLSPYLGLDLRTNDLSIPNYYSFVRPMQQQQLANKAQTARVRQIQQRLRMATAQGLVSSNPSGGLPTTGHSAQFLNMGGYYATPR